MNSVSLINRVKYSKVLYSIYFHLGSMCISLLKCFLKSDEKLIVFNSFGGRKYDDSPKCIYEAMLKDSRFADYKLVWSFINPHAHDIPKGKKVKTDTFLYYKTLLKARAWVTNSSMTRGLAFCGIYTFQLNTWHGTTIKVMGSDIKASNRSFRIKKGKPNSKDIMLAQGKYDVDMFSRAFNRSRDSFQIIGLPRNDVLAHQSGQLRNELKERLGIDPQKRVLLYAPTFREYEKDDGNNCISAPPIDLRRWEKILGERYILLFRAHYEVVNVLNVADSDFVKNVSSYPSLDDLMIASDILISDYSSIFFDYSIMHKPMICYCYDYDKYQKERGMYFDIREWLPSADDEDALLQLITSTDVNIESEATKVFQERYVTEYGSATQKSLDIIRQELSLSKVNCHNNEYCISVRRSKIGKTKFI